MVKFFLRQELARLKTQASLKKEQKKPTDYRLVIYKKLLNLLKAQLSIMIQKLIRKIKQKKQKSSSITEPNPQITKLNQKFTHLKSIKSQTIKQVVIYIMTQVLKLEKMEKVFQRYKFQINLNELKQRTQNSESVKYFIEKISMLTAYKNELQKAADLVDTVAEKRTFRKGQLMQRRIKKKIQKVIIKKRATQLANQPQKIVKTQEQKDVQKSKDQSKKQSRNKIEKMFSKQNKFNKQKSIKKQRTQFKKTGRNKALHQRSQKKHGSFNQQKNRQSQPQPYVSNHKSFQKGKNMHPSWQAKKQLKNQMFIQPFQGKKILL